MAYIPMNKADWIIRTGKNPEAGSGYMLSGKELMALEAKLLEDLIKERDVLLEALKKCAYGVRLYGSMDDIRLVTKTLKKYG